MLPSQASPMTLGEFQSAFMPLVGGVVLAIVLSFFLRETGSAAAKPGPGKAAGHRPEPAVA